jgi:hypothetical protein
MISLSTDELVSAREVMVRIVKKKLLSYYALNTIKEMIIQCIILAMNAGYL